MLDKREKLIREFCKLVCSPAPALDASYLDKQARWHKAEELLSELLNAAVMN